jgi:hypothetical protein
MNDEKLSGGTEYHTGTSKPADLDQNQESSPLDGSRQGGDAAAASEGAPSGTTQYGATAVGTGSTATGTTNTTVDAGDATSGAGSTETNPGGGATMGMGDSSDGPLGLDDAALRAMRKG